MKIQKIALLLFSTVVLTSCYNTKTFCGNVTENTSLKEVTRQRNGHYWWGLKPGKSATVKVGDFIESKDYVVKNHQSFLNMFVNCITLGIYAPTTTTLYVPDVQIENAESEG